jgi:hypothetical protein
MQKSNFMIAGTTIVLLASALSSCKKEEMKPVTNTASKSTDMNSLAKNRNYVRTGIYYEGPGGMFSTCLYDGPACMVVVRPVISWGSGYLRLSPEEGETSLQVDKYKETGVETAYYSRIDVTVDQNGQETYHYVQ